MSVEFPEGEDSPMVRFPSAAILAGALLASLGVGSAFFIVAGGRGAETGPVATDPRSATAQGDAVRGREVFERGNGQCIPCSTCHHADRAEVKVGPPLDGIGLRPREEVIESILAPSAKIAPGFETVVVSCPEGPVAGRRRFEDAEHIVIARDDGLLVTVMKEAIALDASGKPDIRVDPKSPMPDGYGRLLTAQQFSDLLAYLITLRDGPAVTLPSGDVVPPSTGVQDATPSSTVATLAISGMI